MADDTTMAAIDGKLGAILALMLDDRIRRTDAPDRRKERSLEQLLRDAGLKTADIASLLGKSERFVRGTVGK